MTAVKWKLNRIFNIIAFIFASREKKEKKRKGKQERKKNKWEKLYTRMCVKFLLDHAKVDSIDLSLKKM